MATHDITIKMRVLGIDPGTARLGWGIIDSVSGTVIPLAFGCIMTEDYQAPEKRLLTIYDELLKLLKKYKPQTMAVEALFFATNAKTVIPVGQARGVALLAAGKNNTPVVSYSPLAVKQTICGYGKAQKFQMEQMVTKILKLSKVPKPDDTTDALAIALTHAYSYKMKQAALI
jgi:crossover junction endodeoxyribonuclease RuvC